MLKQISIVASAKTSRCEDGRGQSSAHQGMGDEQTEGFRSTKSASQRAEPQVQPTAGATETAHGSTKRRQNGRERLRWHIVAFTTH